MSLTNDFIVELVRAANDVDRLHPDEARRLLSRAVRIVWDMREQAGIPGSHTSGDSVIMLQATAVALGLGQRTPTQIAAALLEAAGMIRDLHIVLDSGTEIEIDERGTTP